MKIYRQGDVLIERVALVPKSAVKQPQSTPIILALGEATGHHHLLERDEIDTADWWRGDNEQFVTTTKPLELTHQEHATIELPRGTYRITQQREYSPEEIRNVAD